MKFSSPSEVNFYAQTITKDLPGLSSGKAGLNEKGPTDQNAELQDVADQFEALFLQNLLKQARESKLSEGLFDTAADDNFVEMFDNELANKTSKSVDIGISDAIVRQMSSYVGSNTDE
jgi:flagellar protein FlgJ